MQNKIKGNSLVLILLLALALPAHAQYNTYSPYTRFGFGDFAKEGFGQNMGMGGTGIAINNSNQLNYLNPAAYTARDSMSVLFDFGINMFGNQYITDTDMNAWLNANFHHIALSLPIGKYFGMGTGLVPYSSVGYNIKQEYNDLGIGVPVDYYFRGDGGIMKFFLGVSGELFNRVSLGVNMNYLLGNLNRERLLVFPANSSFSRTTALDKIQLSNTYFNFGIQYKEVFSDKFFFTVGGTYDLETTIESAVNNSVTNSFTGNPAYLNDSVVIDPDLIIEGGEFEGSITIPGKIGVGLAVGIPGRLVLTGDYTMQNWANIAEQNVLLSNETFGFANARSLHLGFEVTPDPEAFRGYHKLMSYRLGFYRNQSYLRIDDYQLSDLGITFGVGLPVGKTKSSMNASFAFGTRGTTENNLIKENYGILTISVTLHDLWFYKRKFD
jgi:hypothetical protein